MTEIVKLPEDEFIFQFLYQVETEAEVLKYHPSIAGQVLKPSHVLKVAALSLTSHTVLTQHVL